MADKQSAAASKASGWLKTIIGTLAGLCSGAVVMYGSTLIDKVVKPSRPVANFAHEADGLTVTFHNRSAGGSDGWWDFGDGSPLERLDPDQEIVTHTYPAPGEYSAKLMLRNLLGEENERSATVRLESVNNAAPVIEAIEAVPVSPGAYAPATFRVSCHVKNAQVCVWDLGDGRPLEITTDGCAHQDRFVTFTRPGNYEVKLAAVNGSQGRQRSEVLRVNEAPSGTLSVVLRVAEQATRVETINVPFTYEATLPPGFKDKVYRLDRQTPARPGFEIVDVRLPAAKGQGMQGKDGMALDALGAKGARNLRLELAKDRRSVKLTGELVNDGGKTPASVMFPVVLVQERRTPATRPEVPVAAALALPGSAILSLPPPPQGWKVERYQLRLEVIDGDRIIWHDSQLPRNAAVTVRNRRYLLTAAQNGEQVRVDLVEAKPGLNPTAN